ncbi:hypothetical protein DFH29DRAFT_1000790 [Suillus ampliporus]|nr:hypothetical protein DFH29DRAFT_1000790 [Suillus ampliporus]
MTYARRWYPPLDAPQAFVAVDQPKKKLIERASEAKVKKHELKALRTQYRSNPQAFEVEPAELLSDIDPGRRHHVLASQCTSDTRGLSHLAQARHHLSS